MNERDYRTDIMVAVAWATGLLAIPLTIWYSIEALK